MLIWGSFGNCPEYIRSSLCSAQITFIRNPFSTYLAPIPNSFRLISFSIANHLALIWRSFRVCLTFIRSSFGSRVMFTWSLFRFYLAFNRSPCKVYPKLIQSSHSAQLGSIWDLFGAHSKLIERSFGAKQHLPGADSKLIQRPFGARVRLVHSSFELIQLSFKVRLTHIRS